MPIVSHQLLQLSVCFAPYEDMSAVTAAHSILVVFTQEVAALPRQERGAAENMGENKSQNKGAPKQPLVSLP
jgi:hypothetical protein